MYKEYRVLQAPKASRELRERRALWASKVSRVPRAISVRQEHQVLRAHKVHKVQWVPKELRPRDRKGPKDQPGSRDSKV